MNTSGPEDSAQTPSPVPELAGLDPKDLLQAGLETVPPVTLPPQLVDTDATIPVARPQSSQPAASLVELPLPEELTKLLPGGNYQVEGFLGQGGMGAVYKGTQVRLKRPVAIKIMRRDMGRDYDFEARFEREAQAMAKLNHPNIVSVIDFGEAGPDYLYIVMELIDGADLMDVIRGGQMTQEMALTLLPQICDALQFAHDHGIVHRDIKPSNIMLTRDGRIKMADFGLAKRFDAESSFRTQTGTGMGTPDYAAPEQFDPAANIDHRADIYALGVMIYQMITGSLPRGVWKPPSQRAGQIAPQWDSIVSRAMQSDPADRYQHASEVKTDVSSIPLAGKEGSAGAPARRSSQSGDVAAKKEEAVRSTRAPVKSRAPLLIGVVAVVAAAFGAFFALEKPGLGRADAPPLAQRQDSQSASQPSIAATALPESGWKPLFTEAQWRQNEPGKREFKRGLLHLTKHNHNQIHSSPDGAIRARVRMRDDTSVPALVVRGVETGNYKLFVPSYGLKNREVHLTCYQGSNGRLLGKYQLPAPLKAGDELLLEMRAEGTHLQAFVNGVPAIDVQDAKFADAGKWGIMAEDAWFESVEFQPLPAAASEPWQDLLRDSATPLVLSGGASMTAEGLRFEKGEKGGSARIAPQQKTVRNGALRMRVPFGVKVQLRLRERGDLGQYWLHVCSPLQAILGRRDNVAKKDTTLQVFNLPRTLKQEEEYNLELRVVEQTITAIFDESELGSVVDDLYTEGGLGIGSIGSLPNSDKPALVRSLEFLDLGVSVSDSKPAATRDAPFVNTLGMRFVPVPGTQVLFSIWETRVQDYAAYAKAQEAVGKKVDGSWKTMEKDGVPVGREPDHPVVAVNWEDAQAFCQWLTAKEIAEGKLPPDQRYRLPTDEEWSTAVGLPPEQGETPEEKIRSNGSAEFPWGKEWPPTKNVGNYADETFHTQFPVKRNEKENRDENPWMKDYCDGFATTSPVGSFPANAFGLYDMGSNVWQWCEDWWNAEHQDRVLRGTSWMASDAASLRSKARNFRAPTFRTYIYGFRVVLAPPAAIVPASPASAAGNDRAAALMILGKGGTVRILEGGKMREVKSAAELPTGAFEVGELKLLPPSGQTVPLSGEEIRTLSSLPRLETLLLQRTTLRDEDLAVLRTLPLLTRAYLGDNTNLTDEGMTHLAALGQLTLLHLSGCRGVGGEGVSRLASLQNLVELNLGNLPKLDEKALPALTGLRQLQTLQLRGSSGVTPAFVEALAVLPELKVLFLSCNQMSTPVALGRLSTLKEMRVYGAGSEPFPAALWHSLTEAPALTFLGLGGSPLSEAQVAEVARLPALTTLVLENVQLPAAGLAGLQGSYLTRVASGDTDQRFDDAALLSLIPMKSLQSVKLAPGSLVTPAALAEFQKVRPEVKVER